MKNARWLLGVFNFMILEMLGISQSIFFRNAWRPLGVFQSIFLKNSWWPLGVF
jgi:hypothetical protein